ncbi:MAG: signal peptide peptidase SppA [Flavobacteriales bacterium]|nr:signal peptide peptidase SppA [Flavobacteriales bacterium]
MKQFFKIMLASAFGLILAVGIVVVIILAVALGSQEDDVIEENSVLHLTLKTPIQDRAPGGSLKDFNFQSMEPNKALGLNEILENIRKAKDNENIKGIYLDIAGIGAGYATAHEIRDALLDFKGDGDSGKWIVCYSEGLSQKAYYVASVADEIYLNPQGTIQLMGMGSNTPFFTGALKKLDIEAQIIRHGKFKSAVEPFMLEEMSPENREQTEKYVFSIWGEVVGEISESRSISVDEINMIADSLWMTNADKALEKGFVDRLLYKDEVILALRERLGLEDEDDEINYVKLSKLNRVKVPSEDESNSIKREKVAIIYAQGAIVSGKGEADEIGSETIAKAIREARENEKVKAIVLRVNSGGGSALASDVMLREMVLAKESKPVIVSMGDVAASGGYYIACMADTIMASRTTITGSIGVLGILFNAQEFFRNKLGITFDGVRSNPHSDMGSPTRALTEMEKATIQKEVVRIYEVFIGHVANGRPLSVADVDNIGQGRVWSGVDAEERGLVDVFGGLSDAIELAAEMADLEEYKILELPEREVSPLEEILAGMEDDSETRFLKGKLGVSYKHYVQLQHLLKAQGIQAIVPYDLNLN